ncbi:MAG: glycogen/starch synthase [Bacteroidia bacterium]|nr:glycogen/starch synthase [Bacteroidia bacterium]
MQMDAKHTPDYIFETSWEVCNKVGGIYTVLSTKAKSLQKLYKDRIFFIGPDVLKKSENPWFTEDTELYAPWREFARINQNLEIRIGRWNIPGEPIVFLIKFDKFFEKKNSIYSQMWLDFGVDSMYAYGDYDESSIFAYASGVVMESFYRFHHLESENVIAHFNEWQLGMGALYIKKYVPKIATVFTTHATGIGRSIAGNGLPLYNHLKSYNGDQMARELNMVAKHSIEKKAAQNVDCFTTVSDITAQECAQFLQRQPDVVTPNGFEKGFIPKGLNYRRTRKKARETLLNVAEKLLGHSVHPDALLVGISGRYEYKNKGIDVFIDAMDKLRKMPQLSKDVIAFIMIPAWIKGPRKDLQSALSSPDEKKSKKANNQCPYVTHQMHEIENDKIVNHLKYLNFCNTENERVKVIFVPSYLNGSDGIFNMDYYDLLIGLDVSVFPSYYEPWGYTPHESVAFSIPTITTTLAGFGVWAMKNGDNEKGLGDGVQVIYRDDSNHIEVAEEIATTIYDFTLKSVDQVNVLKKNAAELSDKADWAHFISYYQEAYCKALHNSFIRLSKPAKLKAD